MNATRSCELNLFLANWSALVFSLLEANPFVLENHRWCGKRNNTWTIPNSSQFTIGRYCIQRSPKMEFVPLDFTMLIPGTNHGGSGHIWSRLQDCACGFQRWFDNLMSNHVRKKRIHLKGPSFHQTVRAMRLVKALCYNLYTPLVGNPFILVINMMWCIFTYIYIYQISNKYY